MAIPNESWGQGRGQACSYSISIACPCRVCLLISLVFRLLHLVVSCAGRESQNCRPDLGSTSLQISLADLSLELAEPKMKMAALIGENATFTTPLENLKCRR